MKIILAHKFWRTLSGAEMYFHDVVRILKSNGHDVRVFTTNYNAEGGIDEKTSDPNVIYGIPNNYLRGNFITRILNLPSIIYSKPNKLAFGELIDDFKPDVVHCFSLNVALSPSLLDACREKGVPVVMSCNDYKHICTNYRLYHHGKICTDCKGGKLYMPVVNNCCKHSFAFSVASSIEAYVHEYKNILRKNIHTFSYESEFMRNITDEFWEGKKHNSYLLGKPFHAPAYQPHYDHEDYLLYIGRLSDEKGVDILLRAMKLVPHAKLKIVGTGPYKELLENLAKELELQNVEFMGSKWGDEAKDFIRKCRFVVIPSLWYENFPYVITETYALGKALIGSDRGGIPENIVPGETGYVYPADDFTKLAEYIQTMWNNEERTIEMGKIAKQKVDAEFNDTVFYQKLLKLYDGLRLIT
ncbi:MAG: glycosyltransferase family 4 protein [Bacteroidia bacterium]